MKWISFLLIFSFYSHEHFDVAKQLYDQGLEERDSFLKNRAFNEAINEILKNQSPLPEDYWLLGASLMQLRQYPLAEVYFLKALRYDPKNLLIRHDLEEAIALLGVKTQIPTVSQFPPSSWIVATFLILVCLALTFWSHARGKFLKKAAFSLTLVAFLGLLICIILIYRSPILAVTIHPQMLFKTPDQEAQLVAEVPIPEGLIVNVLDVVKEGTWIKIRTQEGVMGYMQEKSIRLVNE